VKNIWWVEVMLGVGIVIVGGCASSGTPAPVPDAGSSTAAKPQPAAPAETPEEPLVNTLKWTTASEVDNFGFDIYRSISEDGPFEKITAEPLPGAGTVDEPQKYVFVDDTIDPTVDYYYYIESISLGGVREKFSPIIRAPAKQPAAGSD